MIRLSPTTGLNLLQNCPRCFWLHYNKKVSRPRGIFPSLPGGMDLVIKKYFDQYRGSLPPEIQGTVEGVLLKDLALMERWRNWRTGLECVDTALGVTLFGALDECLVDKDIYIPLDYKTRGSAPKDGDSERYYQTQLDSYNYLLDANGYKTRGCGYLVYYFPGEVKSGGTVRFQTETVKVATSLERLKKLLERAVAVLKSPLPDPSAECEYCTFVDSRRTVPSPQGTA